MNPAATLAIRVIAETARSRAALGGVQSDLIATKKEADKTSASFNSMSRTVNKSSKDVDRSSRGFSSLSSKVTETNQGMALLGKSVNLIKWPGMIAGAGAAAEGLSAAAGGAAALAGALAPAVGLATQYGVVLTTLGQVKAVIAISGLSDVGDAVGGLTEKIDKQGDAWKALSPKAQKFAEVLDKLQSGPLRRMQDVVQESLFSGLTQGMESAIKNVSALKTVLQATAGSLGFLAEEAGKFVGSKGFGADFEKFGLTNARVIRMMGLSAINLAHAFTDILVVARPLTNWIQDGILAWSGWVKQTTQAMRVSGSLATFFGHTKDVTGDLVSMLGNMGVALFNILKLGAPLGNVILDKLVKATETFREWTESASGENAIARYFKQIRPALFQAGKLLKDLVQAFFEVGKQSQGALAPLLKAVRLDLLPLFTKLIATTSKAFGPALVKLLVQATKLLIQLAGTSGPLMIFVKTLTRIAKALNWMIDNVPGFKTVVVTLLGLKGVGMALSFLGGGKLISGLIKLRNALFGVAAAEGTLGRPGLFRKYGSISGKAWGRAFAVGAVIGLGLLAFEFRDQIKDALQQWYNIARGAGEKVGRILGSGIRHALNDVFVPALNFVIDRVNDLIKAFNFLPGPDIPLIGGIKKLGDATKNAGKQMASLTHLANKFLARDVFGTIAGGPPATAFEWIARAKQQYGSLEKAITHLSNQGRKDFVNWAKSAHDAGKITDDSYSEILTAARKAAETVQHSGKDIGQANDKTGKSFRDTSRTVDDATKDQSKDVRSFANDHDKATREIDRNNDKTSKSFDAGRRSIDKATGHMSGSVHSLASAIAKGEKNVQDNTNKSLKAFGAKELKFQIKQPESTAHHFAGAQKGMDVPGTGVGDKIHMQAMVEPGEKVFVLNRNASQALDDLQGLNKAVPRFQRGGGVGLQGGGFAGMQPEIVSLMKTLISRFGGFMSSGLRAGDSGSFHSQGLAGDWVGGDWSGASNYVNSIGASLLEGIHNAPPGHDVSWDSGKQVPPSFWGSATWGDHIDHIHVATQSAVKGMVSEIARLILKGPKGPLRDMGQGALDATVKAANAYIAKQAPTLGFEMGATGPWVEIMHQIAEQRGWSFPDWMQIVQHESGGDPGAVNPSSGAVGLGQMLGSNIAKYNGRGTPQEQIIGMAQYIADRYGNPSRAWDFWQANGWYKKGGIVQMLAGGGEVLFPEFMDLLPKAVRRDIRGADRKHPARHTDHVKSLMKRFKDSLAGFVVPSKVNEAMENLAMGADMGADYALRAQGLTDMKSVMYDNALAPWLDAAMEEPKVAAALTKIIPENATALQALRDQPKILEALKGPLYGLLPGRAQDALDMLDGQGFLIPEAFQGKNELGWLLSELRNILTLRNQLMDAMKVAHEEAEKIKAWIERAKKAIARLKGRRGLRGVEHDINTEHRKIDRLNKKLGLKKGNYEYVAKSDKDIDPEKGTSLRETLHLLHERQREVKRLRKLENKEQFLKAEIKPLGQAQQALGSWGAHAGIPGGWNYSGPYGEVMDLIQGPFSPDRKVKLRTLKTAPWISAPPFGLLGGDFMSKQAAIMSWLPEQKFDGGFFGGGGGFDTGIDDNTSELLALTQEKLLEAQRRLLVSQAQYPVFSQFAGLFAKGGYIAGGQWGIAGERGPEIVHGPATVTPTSGPVTVELNFANGMDWLEQFVDVKVRHGNQRNVSYARRRA